MCATSCCTKPSVAASVAACAAAGQTSGCTLTPAAGGGGDAAAKPPDKNATMTIKTRMNTLQLHVIFVFLMCHRRPGPTQSAPPRGQFTGLDGKMSALSNERHERADQRSGPDARIRDDW